MRAIGLVMLWLCLHPQVAAASSGPPTPSGTLQSGVELAPIFAREVRPRLEVPREERAAYAGLLGAALVRANVVLTAAQYLLLVDRSPKVQAALVMWADGAGGLSFVGASPVSTGHPGGYEHFLTPLGVFEHSIAHLDFRAEGTRNEFGVLGYGVKDMRVFDFGWVVGERTWGHRGLSPMRLQLHATDPELLEPRLGSAASSGCIRVSATLNRFLDRYGVLDVAYEAAMERGVEFWVLRKDRTPTPWSGRFLVVVESERTVRPPWASVAPTKRQGGEGAGVDGMLGDPWTSWHQARAPNAAGTRAAIVEGASYVVVGPVFTTGPKPGSPGARRDALAHLVAMVARTPVFAIRELTPGRPGSVLGAGAHGVAVRSATLSARGPARAARAFVDALS